MPAARASDRMLHGAAAIAARTSPARFARIGESLRMGDILSTSRRARRDATALNVAPHRPLREAQAAAGQSLPTELVGMVVDPAHARSQLLRHGRGREQRLAVRALRRTVLPV